MESNLEYVESAIKKWGIENQNSSSKYGSIFRDNPREAQEFLGAVKELQILVSNNYSSSKLLVRARKLIGIAMKTMEVEFGQLLLANGNFLDQETVSSRSSQASTSSSFSDFEDNSSDYEFDLTLNAWLPWLKSITNFMISSGYAKECLTIYKKVRKSILEESIKNLGVKKLGSSQLKKMHWDSIELQSKNWLNAAKIAVKTLFTAEKTIGGQVFADYKHFRDSCIAEICNENALTLFEYPELVAKSIKTPDKIFHLLDLWECISTLWPEIKSIFSHESASNIRSRVVKSFEKLSKAIQKMILKFETTIKKDSSKTPVPGGGIDPLNHYVVNYAISLAKYSTTLSAITSNWPLPVPLPESYFSSKTPKSSSFSERVAWIILLLLCKLDVKADLYKDVSLSYLFLANNLNYVVSRVYATNLKQLLGEDWLFKQEAKVKDYLEKYRLVGWSKVMALLPTSPNVQLSREIAEEHFQKFNVTIKENHTEQSSWVIPDPKLRDQVKVSVAKMLAAAYHPFYESYRKMFKGGTIDKFVLTMAPDNLCNYLSDLFMAVEFPGEN